jgi:hypothetical protein
MSKKLEDIVITDQTVDIFNNLVKYYNSCNEAKCNVDESKRDDRIRRFYVEIKTNEKSNGYLLKRNKLLFYKTNKGSEILPKINLYAVLKAEEREEVVEKIWDNVTLLYLSIEENVKDRDEALFGNLTKTMEGGSLGKLVDNLQEDIKKMDVNGMFEKLKSQATPEATSKANNMLSDMISQLTNNIGDISGSTDPGQALMDNLQSLAKDYSKRFESGEFDFGSFLSAVPGILSNPEEITKNIDTSKFDNLKLPDMKELLSKSNLNIDESMLSGLGGAGGIGESLKGVLSGMGEGGKEGLGGKFEEMMSSIIEKQGAEMLDKASKDVEDKKNMKPLSDDQIKELEEYLKNQTLGGEGGGDEGGGMD